MNDRENGDVLLGSRKWETRTTNVQTFQCSIVWLFQMKWNDRNERKNALIWIHWKRVKTFDCLSWMNWDGGNKRRNVLNVSAWHEKEVNEQMKVLTQTVHSSIERHWVRFVCTSQIVQIVLDFLKKTVILSMKAEGKNERKTWKKSKSVDSRGPPVSHW